MWIMVYFDLPTETKQDRKLYARFRKDLLKSGFNMFQYSIYIRHCLSKEYAETYRNGIKRILPPKGHVVISTITDRQFGMLEVFHGLQKEKEKTKQIPILEFL